MIDEFIERDHDPRDLRIVMTVGLPGSGKSSWAKNLVNRRPSFKRVNRDDVRMMLHGHLHSEDQAKESIVTQVCNAAIVEILYSGYDIVVDNTHLSHNARNELITIAKNHDRKITVIRKTFNVPVQELFRRNEVRDTIARIPTEVIERMVERYHVDRLTGKIGSMIDLVTSYDVDDRE